MTKKDLTKFKTPHTYAIIFVVVLLCWGLTFLIPAGKFSTHEVEYTDANGETASRTVLQADTFRYMHPLKPTFWPANCRPWPKIKPRSKNLPWIKRPWENF